jgi:hypothetical protein
MGGNSLYIEAACVERGEGKAAMTTTGARGGPVCLLLQHALRERAVSRYFSYPPAAGGVANLGNPARCLRSRAHAVHELTSWTDKAMLF